MGLFYSFPSCLNDAVSRTQVVLRYGRLEVMGEMVKDSMQASHASAIMRHIIEESGGPLPPNFVVEFLLGDWQQYLALTLQAHGQYNGEAGTAIETAELLLWSVMPMPTEQEKAELINLLPKLIDRIRHGMTTVGTTDEVQSAFLLELKDLHVRLMSGKPGFEAILPIFDPTRLPKPDDTLQLGYQELKCRELMDMLDNAEVEHIDFEPVSRNNWASSI